MPQATQLEVLDLRHFSADQLKPLLRDEATRWQRRLHWDYERASATLLEYLDGRILPGYAALSSTGDHRILGYAFSVFEAAKAVIGDVYAFDETESTYNPTCDTLLHHLIELLQATPGIDRIESQLLMFPVGALAGPFRAYGFRSYPRLFMTAKLTPTPGATPAASGMWDRQPRGSNPPPMYQSWQPEFYDAAAAFIHRCYAGHMDSGINDQYQTMHGSQRFLHNIIRFPGCGIFDAEHSWLLRNPSTRAIEALLLSSRVRSDVAHITQLCVDPALRGRGLGQQLLDHHAARIARAGVRELSLTVTEANLPAVRLYERNGFSTLQRFEAMVWDR
jgi:GNAT superfamily N-acetyltransferase